jgi:FKBP-type peptidyl-prolyl cis-trans isomerase
VLDLALANALVGDEIWIVSPSSLAYGIKGITNCITSRTPVLYKIKVLKTDE